MSISKAVLVNYLVKQFYYFAQASIRPIWDNPESDFLLGLESWIQGVEHDIQ